MRRIILLVVILLVAALAILSFSRKRTGTLAQLAQLAQLVQSNKPRISAPQVPKTDAEKLVADNNAFAFSLYQRLRENDRNLVFSPYSISTALAMTYAGARGETEKQMAKALHFGLPQAKLHPAFNALDLQLARRGKNEDGQPYGDFKLLMANSLWGQKDYKFLPQFLDLVAENYGAGMRLVDYKNNKNREDARKAINDWVSKQTQGKIEDLIKPGGLSSEMKLVLVNAIYFKDQWETSFNEKFTKPDHFTLLDGSKIMTEMMSQRDYFGYAQGKGYQAAKLPYLWSKFSMMILLPDKDKFREFESALNATRLMEISRQLAVREIDLTMPKFKFEARTGLVDTLSEMGMPLVFQGQADLSGMDGTRDLFLSAVLHKAMIAVDEEGTEAAAATYGVAPTDWEDPPPVIPKMIIDRPFIFLIRDTKTGAILFLGRVLNPKA
jgi:serpin B